MVEMFGALLMPTVAVATIVVLVLQYVLANRGLRFALYEKRYAVLKELLELRRYMLGSGPWSLEGILEYQKQVAGVWFVMGGEVEKYAAEMHGHACQLMAARRDVVKGRGGQEIVKQQEEWFRMQLGQLRVMFEKYLSMRGGGLARMRRLWRRRRRGSSGWEKRIESESSG